MILQALGDQRGIYLPLHISGERGGEAGRQEPLISPRFNPIFGALCGEYVNLRGLVCQLPESSTIVLSVWASSFSLRLDRYVGNSRRAS